MNSLAEYILYIYLIVFVSVLVFDIVSIFYKKAADKKMVEREERIANEIDSLNVEDIPNKYLDKLSKKLRNISYFIAFTHAVEKMEQKKRTEYLNNIKSVFLKITPHYQKQEIIRQTYFIHFLSQYPFIYESGMNSLISYIIQCTTKESVYLRENALNVLYILGNPTYIKEAFYQMNYLGIKHHHKLITDGLLKYKGNLDELTDMLMEEMSYYEEDYKVACINFFGYKKIDCCEYIHKILTSPIEYKEVKIACIRYFSNVIYEPVVQVLYDLLKDDKNNWEYSAIAATALRKYPSSKTTEALKEAIRSHNWYVRNNAAASLISLTKKDKIKALKDSIDDKYAREAIDYQLYLLGGDA